jgi:hypothetical protein
LLFAHILLLRDYIGFSDKLKTKALAGSTLIKNSHGKAFKPRIGANDRE